jgi:hypothetical protein
MALACLVGGLWRSFARKEGRKEGRNFLEGRKDGQPRLVVELPKL